VWVKLTVAYYIYTGSVAKITGKEGLVFEGIAKCYDSEELMMEGLNKKEIKKGQG
jgi:dihydroxy-acid dehydratase